MAEEQSKEHIFDWVIGFEDECLKRVREEVILTAEYNFGEKGRKVAEKYYRQIDGEEDYESDEIDEDCDDCKERAKRLIKNMELIQYISAVLMKDSLQEAVKDVDLNNLFSNLNEVCVEIFKKTCFEFDPTELKVRILLEACRRTKNGHST